MRKPGEVLPDKGRSQTTAQLLSKSLLRHATWSWLAGVWYLAGPLASLRLFPNGVKANRPPWDPRILQDTNLAALPAGALHQTAFCQPRAPHPRARQKEVQPLAIHQHILHCLKCSVLATCPVCYETNLMEEMNGILLLKVLCQVY